jgi:hypothetical protein
MRRMVLLACSALLLAAPSGPGQYSWYHEGHQAMPVDPDALVRSWYQRYLRRPAGNGEELSWVNSLVQGQSPEHVLAGILGSTEYYSSAGGTPERFITTLFNDLNGKPPDRRDLDYWLNRLALEGPTDVAYEMLTRYPQHWGGDERPYYPDDHRYDVRRPTLRPWWKK